MRLALLIIITLSLQTLHSQTLGWVKTVGGSDDDFGKSIVIDTDNNVYTIGSFNDTVDFDPGAGVDIHIDTISSAYSYDIFIQKLDEDGNFQWAKTFGGNGNDYGNSICVDSSGNVYVTGTFKGTVDFDTGTGNSIFSSNGNTDFYIMKLDSSGNFIWAKALGGIGNDEGNSICIDSYGNLLVVGSYSAVVDFDPSSGSIIQTALGGPDTFILKLDSNGDFIWVKSLRSSINSGRSIKYDFQGNIIVSGEFSGSLDVDTGIGFHYLLSQSSKDVFILKLDPNGDFIWAKSMGNSFYGYSGEISLDEFGNVYSLGSYTDTLFIDSNNALNNISSTGEYDVFIEKLDINGNLIWIKSFGGSSFDRGNSMSLDQLGNLYIVGSFEDTVDFDTGAGVVELEADYWDGYIKKINPDGDLIWVESFGGAGSEFAAGLDVSPAGDVYVTGGFRETVNFEFFGGVVSATSNGISDIFVLKINQPTLGINEPILSKVGSVYPNPSNDFAYLKLDVEIVNVELSLFDVNGKRVSSSKHKRLSGDINISLPDESGVYFLVVSSENLNQTFKLIRN